MLKQVDTSSLKLAGNRVCKKYRQRLWKRECKNLKAILPTVAKKRVSDVEVIEEAVEYIEQLHRAIAERLGIMPCQKMIAALHMQHKMKMASSNEDIIETNDVTITRPISMDTVYQQKRLPVSFRI